MVESGRMTLSTEEWEMSRSCQSATFSKPACAFERTSRASPLICSAVIGLRLCGMAEDPFCFSLKYSSEKQKRSEEHTSELQSQSNLVCRLLLEKKKNQTYVDELIMLRITVIAD